jgi:hypothetical protein
LTLPFQNNYAVQLANGNYISESSLHEGLVLIFDNIEQAQALVDCLDEAYIMELSE